MEFAPSTLTVAKPFHVGSMKAKITSKESKKDFVRQQLKNQLSYKDLNYLEDESSFNQSILVDLLPMRAVSIKAF